MECYSVSIGREIPTLRSSAVPSEKPVNIYQSTQLNTPDDLSLQYFHNHTLSHRFQLYAAVIVPLLYYFVSIAPVHSPLLIVGGGVSG